MQLNWDSSGTQHGTYSSIPTSAIQQLNQTWVQNHNAASYFNGSELVSGGNNQYGSAWVSTLQTISTFHASFDFEFGGNASAQGLTFCIQNTGTSAVGSSGGGYGYAGISNSAALVIGLSNKTGVSTGGGTPSPGNSTSPVDMTTGDLMHCTLSYSGTTLNMTITDQITGNTFSKSYTVNIPSAVGASTAYVGFTASTSSNGNNCQAYVANLNFGP